MHHNVLLREVVVMCWQPCSFFHNFLERRRATETRVTNYCIPGECRHLVAAKKLITYIKPRQLQRHLKDLFTGLLVMFSADFKGSFTKLYSERGYIYLTRVATSAVWYPKEITLVLFLTLYPRKNQLVFLRDAWKRKKESTIVNTSSCEDWQSDSCVPVAGSEGSWGMDREE